MATLGEIEQALELISQEGLHDVTLLHCTSSYPTVDAEANLRVMDTLRAAFQLPVGYSDHTIGTDIAVAAAALGAVMVEKHFTLDKHLPGPDHAMSLDTAELRAMVAAIRRVEKALGSPVKRVAAGEQDVRVAARRSICAARRIRAGERIVEGVLDFRRPGNGIPPSMVHFVLGRVARKDIESGEMVTWDAL
jgi:N-acetylneuraminate synthase/N,N'-diacetyllegionaminate synthase